jgi:tetratricopeptide (TPR) repeat protein
MFRQVRFECRVCGDGFVDWHDEDWERSAVFCVHCGAQIIARGSVAPAALDAPNPPSSDTRPARSLGVLKSEGDGFPDTLPGFTVAGGAEARELPDASDSSDATNRDTEPTLRVARPRGLSQASSTVPKARLSSSGLAAKKRALGPIAALLLGFATGAPLALFAENPLLRVMNPTAYRNLQLNEELSRVSAAIDGGNWDRARELLEHARASAPAGDSRVATLRARLTLGLILANRPADAGRELSAVPNSASLHPSATDLRRVYEALFPTKPSAAATSANPPAVAPSAPAPKPKVVVTKRELLSFARDRQHRVLLDDAERLYAEVLRTHPNDAEARCGLAEVQLLRGGTEDGAKSFERALADNPSYTPAWVGLADIDWLRGHPERAACRYRAVIDRFPAGSYPPYIAQRVAQVTNSGVDAPAPRAGVSAVDTCAD